MVHLGFPVRIVGKPKLRSHDTRRASQPHLSVSLVYLRDILHYLAQVGIHFYRIASALLPPVLEQLDECATELATIAQQVRTQRIRLTMHLEHHIALGSADSDVVARSMQAITNQVTLLERLGTSPDGVVVVHVGGPSDDRATLAHFATNYLALPDHVRARLVVENDMHGFSLAELLVLHERCGVPVVFDMLHWHMHNPEQLPLDIALGLALATWPPDVRPKVHISTARSEAHLLKGTHQEPDRVLPPRLGQHADFIAVSDGIHLLQAARGLPPFDLMIEAKAGDLALQRLRSELDRVAPDMRAMVD